MPSLNLSVTKLDAFNAFVRQDLIRLGAGQSAPGLIPPRVPIVQIIDDEAAAPRLRRQVSWVLDAAVTYSDDHSDEDAVKATLQTILDGSRQLAQQAGGIPSPDEIINSTFNTYKSLKKIWAGEKGFITLSVRDLPVKFEHRGGLPVKLKATILVDAVWVTDDPEDDGNRAFFEMESLRLGATKQCKATGAFDPASPTGVQGGGRSWFVPNSDIDFIGNFDLVVGSCEHVFNSDGVSVSFDLSCTVTADNTTSVIIRKVELLLEIETVLIEKRRDAVRKKPKK